MSEPLGVVTSCHGYGRWLADWALSILESAVPPAFVGILTHGSEEDRRAGEDVASWLAGSGAAFHVTHRHVAERLDLGEARNRAVELAAQAGVPWVMHLDADDVLLPWALGDVAELQAEADVVALGYVRFGDLNAGPKVIEKVYRSSQGASTLASIAPASGCSPFRVALWRRAPYRTDLLGAWDTALWLGFGHLEARFVPTRRPGFGYRQHADSVFLSRLRDEWRSARVGHRLQSLRRGDAGVAVVVPRAPDGAERDRSWAFMRQWYGHHHPAWTILEGSSPRRAWCKGAAVADALRGCTADVLVVADSDCVVEPAALAEAVARVARGEAPWVVPHTLVHRLTPFVSEAWMAAGVDRPFSVPDEALARPAYRGYAGGGLFVVRHSDYVATRGIPTAFVGWGGEDEALAVILDTLLGAHQRLPGDLVHLWHPPSGERRGAQYRGNKALWHRYLMARDDQRAMWGMVQGRHAHHLRSYFDPLVRHRTTGARARAVRQEVAMSQDSFAARRLARNYEEGQMGSAFDLKQQQRQRAAQVRREQAARNEETYATRPHRADVRRDAGAVERSLKGAPSERKVVAPGENKGGDAQGSRQHDERFASVAAEEAALAAGLSEAQLKKLAKDAGKKGITVAQVREATQG